MSFLTSREHNRRILSKAQKGDLLEFPRVLYSHWAVYVGNGKVIHLAGEPGAALSAEDVSVRLDDFWTVAETSLAKINNILDSTETPLPPNVIVARAQTKLNHKGYNLFTTNCEHFATWCRYDIARSKQVETFNKAVDTAVAKIKPVLLNAASSHPNPEKRELANVFLTAGQVLGNLREIMVNHGSSEPLPSLTPKKDDPSKSGK